jgi:hypothetical protein
MKMEFVFIVTKYGAGRVRKSLYIYITPPTWRTRVSLFVWFITLTCLAWEALPVAYATVSIALGIM